MYISKSFLHKNINNISVTCINKLISNGYFSYTIFFMTKLQLQNYCISKNIFLENDTDFTKKEIIEIIIFKKKEEYLTLLNKKQIYKKQIYLDIKNIIFSYVSLKEHYMNLCRILQMKNFLHISKTSNPDLYISKQKAIDWFLKYNYPVKHEYLNTLNVKTINIMRNYEISKAIVVKRLFYNMQRIFKHIHKWEIEQFLSKMKYSGKERMLIKDNKILFYKTMKIYNKIDSNIL